MDFVRQFVDCESDLNVVLGKLDLERLLYSCDFVSWHCSLLIPCSWGIGRIFVDATGITAIMVNVHSL